MDFPLSSSVILVIAVALWIVWVAPYMLRNGHHRLQPAGELMMDAVDAGKADPQAGILMKTAAPQETPMTSTQRPGHAGGTIDVDGGPKPAAPAFRIRYGRLAVFVLGVLSLFTGIVSGILRIFGLGSGWLPAGTLLGAAAAVVLLRRLAVRDRRRKLDAAFRSAMQSPVRALSEDPAAGRTAAPAKESPLFDAEAGSVAPAPALRPLTADELRQAALAEAAASGDTSVQRTGDPALEGSSWEPVEVPKPTYVEAPKAERAAPEPLDLPEAPKAVGKPSLKQGTVRQPEQAEAKPLGRGQSALSNLDDVLQRRRA
ncbi:hypothetical protein ACTWLI_10210 [Arthrobacter sp. Hor0625]|uniref:hypothetical protein n=1 Tax=Arthrobacter sp. Hor0625 TaxID=3457358 RepID=UPI00403ED855